MAAPPRFSPDSFFFTDPAAITQAADQAFGPISADQYRLTSKFSVAADTKAFAVCTGVVLVQPQAGNSALVNVILRPFKQPITGFNIKYFIYRGLHASEFFNGDNIVPPGVNASDFINKINASFTAYYANLEQTAPTFLAKYIGFDPANQPADTLVSDVFFKTTEYTDSSHQAETDQTAFELPMVSAGDSLGTFAAGECGIDIVIDYGDYKLPTPKDQFVFDLAYARAAEKIIDLTTVTGDFQKKLLKEQIFQFLDAAAFYGFHTANGTVSLKSTGTVEKKTGIDIYNSVIQNFATKNHLYLYIQSDRTRSYNFYSNYKISDDSDNSLNAGDAEDSLTARTYSTEGWPLITINTPQHTSDSNNRLYLQFVTDNNDNVVLYGQVAQIVNAKDNNFCGPDNLRLLPDEGGNSSNLTKVIQVSNPATESEGTNNYVAAFNVLIYEGKKYNYVVGQTIDTNGDVIDVVAETNLFDDVFGQLNAEPNIRPVTDTGYSSIRSQRARLINHLYNNTQFGVSAVQTAIINDELNSGEADNPSINRVIYMAEAIDILNNAVDVNGSINANAQTGSSVSGSVKPQQMFQPPSSAYYTITQFTDNGQLVNGLSINSTDNTIPTTIILGIIKAENDLLLALNADNLLVNVRLFLIDLFEDVTQLISTENILYRKFKAAVVGEDSAGTLKLLVSETDVIIYTLDNRYYYSKAFSDYVEADNSIKSLILDPNISL